ncbi:hypothetical protein OsI_00428 [Oryza sativa Indica Group]|uniref:Uncharacterized protein n=1 Tax=Oryza sativa subsp. indica TaxID=39946 RepID=A2WKR6_ORYSI|nr:hypothetical protein OsI_00428 [Oryza sativa Indica Group]
MAFPSLSVSGILARHPVLFYAATWTAVATAAVSVAAFAPELAFVWAVTPRAGAGAAPLAAGCPGGIVLPLDGPPWDAACVPAALFGRVTLDVLVPPVFAAAVVSAALWFTKAVGVWEDDDDEDDSNEATMLDKCSVKVYTDSKIDSLSWPRSPVINPDATKIMHTS